MEVDNLVVKPEIKDQEIEKNKRHGLIKVPSAGGGDSEELEALKCRNDGADADAEEILKQKNDEEEPKINIESQNENHSDAIINQVVEGSNCSEQRLDDLEHHEKDYTIFHCVSYLGATAIKEPKSEPEIHEKMKILNEQSIDQLIQVSVSVPLYSDGSVIVYEEENQSEIRRFGVSEIIFFARGLYGSPDWACFAFTCSHGQTIDVAIFQCHVFRCDVPEAVARVFSTFARTFSSPCKSVALSGPAENVIFEVSLELKEDDGKGNYSSVPRDKGLFKLRSFISKHIVLTVQQLPHSCKELEIDRCFGVLLSPGRHVRHSDMQLVEMLSWSTGTNGTGGKTYVIVGHWDVNDPAFESLNQETPKESQIFFTVAVDLVIKGIQEPIRFALEVKGKIYPGTERFWSLVRKHHFTQQFILSLEQIDDKKSREPLYKVIRNTPGSEVERARMNFNLNFTSFIRSSSINSIDTETTPGKDEEQEDSDDDEPLQSGMGEISKDCTDEQISSWKEVLSWPSDSPRPKQLSSLVRNGIPNTMRCEMWLRLAGCQDEVETMKIYRTLMSKVCPNEDVILRDITRTFPANDYFRESGGAGQEQLYKISKGYAVYDTEVGYCQGISFIAAALLLQMPEEQAFCLLVKIMYNYEFRDLYRDGFENLRLKLYQLDRLIEDQIPELWAHFLELGIESHMYANQWFLTLYTAKFPLIFVFRVLDSFLLDGIKVLFQIALALLSGARKDLLVLDFEGILKYFRVSLPKKYRNAEATSQVMKVANGTKVKKLKRYAVDFQTMKENQVDPLERLQKENKTLIENMLRSEHLITKLVLEKMSADEALALYKEELGKTKIQLQEVEEFNEKLKSEADSVKELFQREVAMYDKDAEKSSKIISEYKQICTKLSSQLEEEQKMGKERNSFFQSNLCENCSSFVATALQIASNKQQLNGDVQSGSSSPSLSGVGSPQEGSSSPTHENALKPLENELAETKFKLVESECRNDELEHELSLAMAELEICRNSHGQNQSATSRLWKNFTSGKDSKRSSVEEGSLNTGNGTGNLTSSLSLQNIIKK